jgi:hypothetical protein
MLDFEPDMVESHCKPRFGHLEQKGNIFASYKLKAGPKKRRFSMAYSGSARPGVGAHERVSVDNAAQAVGRGLLPKLFAEDLTSKEAARRIEVLKREVALANSF